MKLNPTTNEYSDWCFNVCHTVLWVEIVLEAICIMSNGGSNKPGSQQL